MITRLQHLGVHVIESEYDRVERAAGAGLSRPQAEEPAVNAPPSLDARRWSTRPASARRMRRIGSGWRQIVTRMEKRSIRALERRRSAGAAGALPDDAVVAVGRARHLARPSADHLSRAAVHPRLFPDLRRADARPGGSSAASSRSGWPEAVRALWRETLFCVAADLRRRARRLSPDPQRSELVLQHHPRRAGRRARSVGVGRVSARRRSTTGAQGRGSAIFATFLFTHNSQIAIFAFALGFAFAVPTVLLILYNGLMLGAFLAVFAAKGWLRMSPAG